MKTKTNIDFILFAVEQAKQAEAYGFTRNECTRNLKTALHQYWQNKTLGQHGQGQKANLLRSARAVGKPISECDVEHVVPQMVIVNMLMGADTLDAAEAERILRTYFRVLLVTKEEHAMLNASGLRSTMPSDWDGVDPWARYRAVGITRGDAQ